MNKWLTTSKIALTIWVLGIIAICVFSSCTKEETPICDCHEEHEILFESNWHIFGTQETEDQGPCESSTEYIYSNTEHRYRTVCN